MQIQDLTAIQSLKDNKYLVEAASLIQSQRQQADFLALHTHTRVHTHLQSIFCS